MGRRKLEMKKIEDRNSLQVCFSKRRKGLFKKASELCILSGAQLAIIVFSPAGKPYTFAHPSVETILERFLGPQSPSTLDNSGSSHDISGRLTELEEQLAAEEERHRLAGESSSSRKDPWWEVNVNELQYDQLEGFVSAIKALRRKVLARAEELSCANMGAMPTIPDQEFQAVEEPWLIDAWSPSCFPDFMPADSFSGEFLFP